MGIDSSITDWTVNSFLAHVVPEDRDEVEKAVDVTSDTDRFRATCRIVRGDGNLRWIAARGDVLRDDRGRARRVIGIVSDITDRKEQEDRHRLMAIMQEREDFMATLTHDMKNPLLGANRVLQSLSSGQLGALTDQQSVLLDSLVDNNCNVLSLISNLIEVYRMEKEANVFLPTDVDLIALVSGALTQVKSIAALRDINFTTQLATGSLLVRADSGAIVRVIRNLMDNAVKFTRKGGAIKLRLFEQEGFAVVEVEDNGPGIPPDDMPLLFKRFSQGEVGKRFSGGNGLGLYLCKQIVEAHGGAICCESIVQTCTVFKFSLPLKKVAVPKKPCAQSSTI